MTQSVPSEAQIDATESRLNTPKRMVHRQVGTLLRKNAILKVRSWKCSCCEILLPIILSWLIFQLPGLLGLDFERKEVVEADPVSSNGYPRAQDFNVDFVDDTRYWGIFRRQPMADSGQSCWCKSLAIVAKGDRQNELANELKSYFEGEYEKLENEVINATGHNFTYHWQLGNQYVPGFVQGGYGDSDAREIFLTNWAQCGSWETRTIFRIFSDEDALKEYIEDENYGSSVETTSGEERGSDPLAWDRLCGAVVLENDVLRDEKPEFKIRLNATIGRISRWITRATLEDDPRGIERHVGDDSARHFYIRNGFLAIQLLVQRFIASRHEAVTETIEIPGADINNEDKTVFKRVLSVPFPVEPYWSSDGIDLVSDLTWLVVFAFSASVSVQISRLIREKEMRLREIMRMMGLLDVSYYVSWLITQIVTWLVICLAISLVMKVGTYKNSSWVLIFMLNFSFGLSSMSFAFLMSAIFTRERVGAVIGFFVYLAGLFISVPEYASASTKNFMSFIPIVGFREGLNVIGFLEETYGGLSSDNTTVDYRNYSYAQSVAMNFLASVLWWILYYYVDQTNPYQIGFRRPYYFMFQKSYWLECFGGDKREMISDDDVDDNDERSIPREKVDAYKEALRKAGKCVEITKLCKKFKGASGETITAVNGVTMSMYEGEIFALLGHNGAGKTTTMGAITGFLSPTSGRVSVYGLEIPKDMAAIRCITGVCPQHNALWPELTAMEHLECFGGIRGFNRSSKAFRDSCDHLLLEVGLGGRRDFRSDSLSGGMQRKLSVAIAFVGDPKLVILDEPTSGMDPYARRTTWELLKARRPGRIICLTTHYMDEADVLGDRIAIMGSGELKCLGSSSFLKKCYGCGYVLSFVKKKEIHEGDESVVKFLKERIGDRSLVGQVRLR